MSGTGEPWFREAAGRLAGLAAAALGWVPDVFWRATPEELATVLRALSGDAADAAPLDAALLARMQEAYPDG